MDSHFNRAYAFPFFKLTAALLSVVSVLLLFASCKSEIKTTYELLCNDEPDDALVLIVNNPKEEVISKVEVNKSITLSDDGDRFLVIPKYKNSIIEIFSVKKNNHGEYVEKESVYFNEAVSENFVLDVYALRLDEPQFELVVRTKETYSKYLLKAVSGKTGEESFEYVTADNADFSKETPFNADEIAFISYRDGAYLKRVYGQPSNEVTFERSNGSTATRMFFDNTLFEISNIDSRVYHAIMLDDKLPHIRGIKIGESLPMVLVNFPNESDGYTAVYNGNDAETGKGKKEGASYTYQLLYGVFGVGKYGYIKYDAREVVTEVIYVDNGCSVVFAFKNNRVLSIEYRFEP